MLRAWLMLFALFASAGAAPAPDLPLPPTPPDNRPSDQRAPVPDWNAKAPTVASLQSVQVIPSDFRIRRPDPSAGYAPGSHFQTTEEKRPIQTPGLTLRIPLRP